MTYIFTHEGRLINRAQALSDLWRLRAARAQRIADRMAMLAVRKAQWLDRDKLEWNELEHQLLILTREGEGNEKLV